MEEPTGELLDQAVGLLRRYMVDHRTERLVDLAPVVVELRSRHTLADGRTDWAGRSPEYRTAMGTVYARAGMSAGERDTFQSALRYHVGNLLHERLDADELAAAGFAQESPRKRLASRTVTRVLCTEYAAVERGRETEAEWTTDQGQAQFEVHLDRLDGRDSYLIERTVLATPWRPAGEAA